MTEGALAIHDRKTANLDQSCEWAYVVRPEPKKTSPSPKLNLSCIQSQNGPKVTLKQNHTFNCFFKHIFWSTTLQNCLVYTKQIKGAK